jgi:hypothetical protein
MIKLIFEVMDTRQADEVLQMLRQDLTVLQQADKKEQLQLYINDLLLNDFNGLIYLLYRVDVNEKKLKTILAENKDCDAAIVITDLLIERMQQKEESRKNTRSDKEISEEEKW